jgi:hypothetical protein
MSLFGVYAGVVLNTIDPSMDGRLQVSIPGMGSANMWAAQCRSCTCASNMVVGAKVWIAFAGGNASHPVVLGSG